MAIFKQGHLIALKNGTKGRITNVIEGNGTIGVHYLVKLHQTEHVVNVPEANVKGLSRSHAFADLKTHAEKITSFNQAKHLQVCDEDSRVMQWAKSGVCAGLTTMWLHEKFSLVSHSQFGKNTKEKNVTTVGKAMGLQHKYKILKSQMQLLELKGLQFCDSVGTVRSGSPYLSEHARVWLESERGQRHTGGAYVSCSVSFPLSPANNSGHALGFFHDKTHFYFFDSNAGVYRMSPANMLAFFDAYEAAYDSIGAELSGVEVLPIEKK